MLDRIKCQPSRTSPGTYRALSNLERNAVYTIRMVFAAALTVIGCNNKDSGLAQPDPSPAGTSAPGGQPAATDPAGKAKEIFAMRCVPCHGSTGQGDGAASAALNPKPRKYADRAWQASVTDDYIMNTIKVGGAAVGKSPAMPGNPDLDPHVIAALKDIVRSFGKP